MIFVLVNISCQKNTGGITTKMSLMFAMHNFCWTPSWQLQAILLIFPPNMLLKSVLFGKNSQCLNWVPFNFLVGNFKCFFQVLQLCTLLQSHSGNIQNFFSVNAHVTKMTTCWCSNSCNSFWTGKAKSSLVRVTNLQPWKSKFTWF